jgi:hypothetical protein
MRIRGATVPLESMSLHLLSGQLALRLPGSELMPMGPLANAKVRKAG